MPKAFITGIGGQDGRHLAPYLRSLGYEVHGLVRGQDFEKRDILKHELDFVKFHEGDITDQASLISTMKAIRPDEVYHLAGASYVPMSWSAPSYVMEVNVLGTINLLEAVRHTSPYSRVVVASSSEVFGNVRCPQHELSSMKPVSVYGLSKLCILHLARQYRDHYDLFTSCAISFNHESPLRPPNFVTRKITRGVARIKCGLQEKIQLGNLDAKRDWGYALDYMIGMHKIVNHKYADDFVLGTGASYSVRELLAIACEHNDIGLDPFKIIELHDSERRPEDIMELRADPVKAHDTLDWEAETSFDTLIDMMVRYDLSEVRGKPDGRMFIKTGDFELAYG